MPAPAPRPGPGHALPPPLAAAIVFFASGSVLVLEVVGLRLVAPYVGVTLQTSSAVIGVALAAIAVGAWLGGRVADTVAPRRLLPMTLVLAGTTATVTLPLVRLAGSAMRADDPLSVTVLAFIAVFAPCVFLAAVPPMVVKLQLRELGRTGTVVGQLSGIGTLGAIIATFATGFILLAALPTSAIVLGLGAGIFLVGLALGLTPGAWRRPPAAVLLLGLLSAATAVWVPSPCLVETAYHCGQVLPDPDRSSARRLVLDTVVHSDVDVADPTYLRFGYTQAIASTADVMRPPGEPLEALHLGAGALTLPRYLAATRPGSRSRVVEVDPGVLALDRDKLRLGLVPGVQVDVADARVALSGEPSGSRDLVVGDAFGGLAVPWHLTTREVVAEIARILKPDGVYALNLIDHPPNRFAYAEVATVASVFPQVAVVAAESAIEGRSGGNFVIVASARPLPVAPLRQRLLDRGSDLTVASDGDAGRFAGRAPVLTDDYAPVDQLLTPHPS